MHDISSFFRKGKEKRKERWGRNGDPTAANETRSFAKASHRPGQVATHVSFRLLASTGPAALLYQFDAWLLASDSLLPWHRNSLSCLVGTGR